MVLGEYDVLRPLIFGLFYCLRILFALSVSDRIKNLVKFIRFGIVQCFSKFDSLAVFVRRTRTLRVLTTC